VGSSADVIIFKFVFNTRLQTKVNINGQLMWAYDLKHKVQNFINHTPTNMYETVITIHLM